MLSRSVLFVVLAALIGACASSPERVAQRNHERCVNRGLKPDTKEFEDCLTRVETERQLRMDANRMDMWERNRPLRRD